jgi:hypothetical protein
MNIWRPKPVFRTRALFLALVLTGLLWTQAGSTGTVNVAGLVVDYGDGRISYVVVPFEEDSISGMDLLERSGLDLLTIEIGGMGAAICEIEDVGCDVNACRTRMCQTGDPASPFWRHMIGTDGDDWRFSSRGAGSSVVEDGDVYAWFWSGDDPTGPSLSVDDLAQQVDLDLDTYRQSPPEDLNSTLVTLGGEPVESDETSRWQVVSGAAALLAVAALGGFALYRSRPRGAP